MLYKMDGGKTRGRIYRQRIIEVLVDYWELTPNQRSSVIDSLSNHIILRGRRHLAIGEWEPLNQKLRIMLSFISAAKSQKMTSNELERIHYRLTCVAIMGRYGTFQSEIYTIVEEDKIYVVDGYIVDFRKVP